ncbi:MAG TPA: hypothetical protein VF477_22210 [Mycobacterium sp.]
MTYPPQWNSGGGQWGGDPFRGGYQAPGDPFAQGQPQAWPGYGGQPPTGPPPPFLPPPRRDNTGWVIATVAAVVIVAVLVGGLVWKLNGSNDSPQAAPATTTTKPSATSTTRTTTSTPSSTPTAAPAPAPPSAGECKGLSAGPTAQTPPGWQTVLSPRGLAYDVPSGWTVLSCESLVGWEKTCPETPDSPFGTCPIRTMSGAASLANPVCPDGNSLALTGVPGAKNTSDINQAVRAEATLVEAIYTSASGAAPSSVALSDPRSLTVAGAPAVEIIATVTGIAADRCTAPRALHVMVATTVPGQPGTVLFVVSMAQDYAGAPDAGLVDQLVASLRRAS